MFAYSAVAATFLFIIILLGGVIALGFDYRSRVAMLNEGIRATGTIVALETTGLRLLDYYPVVRFQTPQGTYLTLRSQTSGKAQNWSVGQKVEVRYPPSSPENFVVVSGFDLLWQQAPVKKRRR